MAINPAIAYGRDIACGTDADELWSSATGVAVVRQAAYHRLTNDDVIGPGGDGWGYDVRRLLGAKSSIVATISPVLSEVLQRDPRIETADIQVRAVRLASGLDDVSVRVRCTTAAGPFDLVLSARDLTTATIEGQVR